MNSTMCHTLLTWFGECVAVHIHPGIFFSKPYRQSLDFSFFYFCFLLFPCGTPSLLGGEPYTLPYNFNLLSCYHMMDGNLQKENSSLDAPPMVIYVHMQTTAALHLSHNVSPVWWYLGLSINYCIVLFINTRNMFFYIYLRWIGSELSPSFSVILMLKNHWRLGSVFSKFIVWFLLFCLWENSDMLCKATAL